MERKPGVLVVNIHLPLSLRQRLKKAEDDNLDLLAENLELRTEFNRQNAKLRALDVDIVVANVRADKAKARADALEQANDELRADWASWMNREMSSE